MLINRATSDADPSTRAQVIARALKDSEYRQQLVRDPAATLGIADSNRRLRVLEEDAHTIYVVLPRPGEPCRESSERPGSELIRLVAENASLRSEFLEDPRVVIERMYETRLPATIRVVAVEETAEEEFLVLPPRIDAPSFTPSDQMMEQLAASICWGSDTGTAKPGKGMCTHATQTGSCCHSTSTPSV